MLTKEQILNLLGLEAEADDLAHDPDLTWLRSQIHRSIRSRQLPYLDAVGCQLTILWANYGQIVAMEDSGKLICIKAERGEDEDDEDVMLDNMSAYGIFGTMRQRDKLDLIIPQEVRDELSRLITGRDEIKKIDYEARRIQQEIQELRRLQAKYPDQATNRSPA